MNQKMLATDIVISEISVDPLQTFSDSYYRNCAFCNKSVLITKKTLIYWNNQEAEFYCINCFRNDFNGNKNILILSFRAIFGFFYYQYYVAEIKPLISLAEISQLILDHTKTGFENPFFHYDQESFFWFVDFTKLDRHEKKLDLILPTIKEILDVFQLEKWVINLNRCKLDAKFYKAIEDFYIKRHRQGVLIPSLYAVCDDQPSGFSFAETKKFDLKSFKYR
jgi:hypothetical protein